MKSQKKKGFTLTEIIMALGIGTVVLAGVGSFLVQTLLVCRDVMAETYLCQQSHLARERILRRVEMTSNHGLREAEWASLNVWEEGSGVDFMVSTDDSEWADEEDVSKEYCYVDAIGYYLTRYDVSMEKEFSYEKSANHTVDTTMKFVLNFGGKSYTNLSVVSTRVVN